MGHPSTIRQHVTAYPIWSSASFKRHCSSHLLIFLLLISPSSNQTRNRCVHIVGKGLASLSRLMASFHSGWMPKFAWALIILQIYLMATQRLLLLILDCYVPEMSPTGQLWMDTGHRQLSSIGSVNKSMCRLPLQDVRSIFLGCLKDVLPSSVNNLTKIHFNPRPDGTQFSNAWWGAGRTILPHFPSALFSEDLTDKRKTRFKARQKLLRKLPGSLFAQVSIEVKRGYH